MRPVYLLEGQQSEPGDALTDFVQVDPVRVGEAPRCEACGEPIGMLPWLPPLRVEIETWGTKFGDLAFGPGDSFLVSERFERLWEREQLVGLHGLEPVEIVRVRNRGNRIKGPPPKYCRVWAGRSDVAIDPVRSGIRWVDPPAPPCETCRGGIKKGWERIVLEGQPRENLFIARGLPGRLLADDRFERFCEEHAISNCHLIPAEQASHWF